MRTLLFVPGSDQRKLAKVALFEPDAVVIDLEDAVAEDQKDVARALACNAIPECGARGAAVFVRINAVSTGRMEDDVAAVARRELTGVMVPKTEHPDGLASLEQALAAAERARGIPSGTLRVLVLIETAAGVADCERLLAKASARTLTAVLGTADLSTDLGIDITAEGSELLYARSRLVMAARAAGLAKPIDGPWLRLEDTEGLSRDCARSRSLGFQGRVTIHPGQVETVHRAYSQVSAAELTRLHAIACAFEKAQARGVASIRVGGEFVDYPVYRRAKERIALAKMSLDGEQARRSGSA